MHGVYARLTYGCGACCDGDCACVQVGAHQGGCGRVHMCEHVHTNVWVFGRAHAVHGVRQRDGVCVGWRYVCGLMICYVCMLDIEHVWLCMQVRCLDACTRVCVHMHMCVCERAAL